MVFGKTLSANPRTVARSVFRPFTKEQGSDPAAAFTFGGGATRSLGFPGVSGSGGFGKSSPLAGIDIFLPSRPGSALKQQAGIGFRKSEAAAAPPATRQFETRPSGFRQAASEMFDEEFGDVVYSQNRAGRSGLGTRSIMGRAAAGLGIR
jgi:hypothetical protein